MTDIQKIIDDNDILNGVVIIRENQIGNTTVYNPSNNGYDITGIVRSNYSGVADWYSYEDRAYTP